jgi:putative OPT family oligopeptide transporter
MISTEQHIPEVTLKAVILAILLTLMMAAANAFLALKIGILTSASISASLFSLGILGLFKNTTILEHNLVQTTAAAGEAVAGGIVYTIPALIIIHYWLHFPYLPCFLIALCGGLLGALFSIPLRRVLVNDPNLNFPEGRAIAEVLKTGMQQQASIKEMLWGGAVGALLELAQSGLKLISSSWQIWTFIGTRLVGFDIGFSATLLGAGYLVGFTTGLSLLIGAILGWLIGIPYLSGINHLPIGNSQLALVSLQEQLRYIGVGAMLTSGIWTIIWLLKPCLISITKAWKILRSNAVTNKQRIEYDIPSYYVILGIGLLALLFYFFAPHILPIHLSNTTFLSTKFILICLFYLIIIGFIAAALCAYFSGMLGVSATPGSAVMIAVLVLAAVIIRAVLPNSQLLEAAAISIILGAIVTGCGCVADNLQVFKVGHILGATPWKQQIMFILGIVLAACIIPLVMELLFNVYGITNVLPHAGMDSSQTLPAPVAAVMATMTRAIFQHALPWNLLEIGVDIGIMVIIACFFLAKKKLRLSPLAVATGIYLPLPTSTALFIGSFFALIVKYKKARKVSNEVNPPVQRTLLLACGIVAGAAIMDVLLAIPFALAHNPDILRIIPASATVLPNCLGILVVILLGWWFYRLAQQPGR